LSAQHHYVTSAYLDGFLVDKEKLLYVYTRDRETFFRAQPDKVARRRNYYSQEREDGTVDDKVELMLQQCVEDPGLAVIRKLNTGKYTISAKARGELALLLAIQEYRVPWMRNHTEELVNIMQKQYSDMMLGEPGLLEKHLEEMQKDKAPGEKVVTADGLREAIRSGEIYIAKHPGASLWAMGQAADILTHVYFGMQWIVLEGRDVPFITSDCPVHRYFLPVNTQVPYGGLMDWRVQVRFPLSRSRMLVLTPDMRKVQDVHELMEKGKKEQAEKRHNANSQVHTIQVSGADVSKINSHTLSMAAHIAISPIEMPEFPPLFRGECQNVRSRVRDLGNLMMVTAEYGQTAKK
jgi:hypothetical protein